MAGWQRRASPWSRQYKSLGHFQAAQASRGDWASARVGVNIDMREIRKLECALREAGLGYKRSQTVLAQSLNRAAMRVRTQLKRSLQQWTGIRSQARINERLHVAPKASAGHMSAGVLVTGRHLRITKTDFGASWRKSWSGGKHKAWGRSQTARGSFMIFSGGAKYGGGLLFTRTSKSRFPIRPLWGPNLAREVERHRTQVQVILDREAKWFLGESRRRVDVELKRAKSKYGL